MTYEQIQLERAIAQLHAAYVEAFAEAMDTPHPTTGPQHVLLAAVCDLGRLIAPEQRWEHPGTTDLAQQ